jgi:hypothetical protein
MVIVVISIIVVDVSVNIFSLIFPEYFVQLRQWLCS